MRFNISINMRFYNTISYFVKRALLEMENHRNKDSNAQPERLFGFKQSGSLLGTTFSADRAAAQTNQKQVKVEGRWKKERKWPKTRNADTSDEEERAQRLNTPGRGSQWDTGETNQGGADDPSGRKLTRAGSGDLKWDERWVNAKKNRGRSATWEK